jgi:hypothetical protein
MFGNRRWVLGFALIAAAAGSPAQAQYGRYLYPRGYGDYGWSGWGGGGASTVQGSVARGLGVMAAGAGAYNEQTAVARSINADTAMRWNQYVWQSQQEANRRYHAKLAQQQLGNSQARDKIYRRLRDNPEPADIYRGDALNVALDEVTRPNVYFRKLKGASAKVPGKLIRAIPFQYASAAITTSVAQLTQGGPPDSLKTEAFAADRAKLKELAAQLRKQNEEKGQYDPATLAKAQEVIHAVRVKVEKTLPRNTKGRDEAEKYLKALFGLTRMLQTPAIDVLLAGVEKRPDTTVGDLLTFMTACNLRFGVAKTDEQRAVYDQLYPLLVALRDEAQGSPSAPAETAAAPANGHERPGEFFAGMSYENIDPAEGKIPPPPRPQPAPK